MPFLPPRERATGTAVVIFPGGGYGHLALDKEGAQVARRLNEVGVAAFVVRYRLGPRYHHPAMLQDAQRAVRTVRARAAEWGIVPSRVGVAGFSAGGHLASTVGTHFDAGASTAADVVERASSRPDFMILIYPVITMADPFAHTGSRTNLLGQHPSAALVRLLSNETQVTRETPPAFLVATTDDPTVPVENTVMFYQALHAAGVAVEMHVYESGRHGFGLAPADPVLSSWMDRCTAWMRRRGLLDRAGR
jgi:acetyl esterase/lipase